MTAGTYAGPRNCPNCHYPIPPGHRALCPSCQHPLFTDDKDGKDDKLEALTVTGVHKLTETREPDDTVPSSTPLVPAYLRHTPVERAAPSPPAPPTTPSAKPPPPTTPSATPPPPTTPTPKTRPKVAIALVAFAVVLAVGLGYVAYRVARPIVGPSAAGQLTAGPTTPAPSSPFSPSGNPTDEPSPTEEPSPTTEPELKRVKKVTAKASSTLPPDNYTYVVENTLDRDPTTAWNSNGSLIGPLARVTLTYRFSKPVQLREIEIYNGYQRSKETFASNSRVQRLLITTDATEESFELEDKDGGQTLTHDFGETDKVVLTIEEVYRDETTRYNDVAISDVTFFRI